MTFFFTCCFLEVYTHLMDYTYFKKKKNSLEKRYDLLILFILGQYKCPVKRFKTTLNRSLFHKTTQLYNIWNPVPRSHSLTCPGFGCVYLITWSGGPSGKTLTACYCTCANDVPYITCKVKLINFFYTANTFSTNI